MSPWRRDANPIVIAHRGHMTGAPEQTMAAFNAAIELGADMIEADVRRSRDGHLVLLHDATLDRTTNGRGPVAALSLAELRQLDAGHWFSAEFTGERLPTLAELFDLAEQREIGLCLEVKGETPAERALHAHLVAAQIARRGRLGRDVLASFDHGALAAAAIATPGLAIAPERLPERGASSAAAIVEQARRVGTQLIQHHFADLSADIVSELHAADLAVWAWPPTTPIEVAHTQAMRVDGVMGDDVAVMMTVVRGRHAESADATSATQPLAADS